MNDKKFGEKLKELRKAKGYTQETLAEKAEIDEKHLSRIENGKYFPTYSTLTRLLKALDLSVEDVGMELEHVKVNTNPLYSKAMQILNSAKNDKELTCYIDSLKNIQKALEIGKSC